MTIRLSLAIQPPLDALFGPLPVDDYRPASPGLLDVLRELCRGSDAARAQVLAGNAVSPFVHVFVNGEAVAADAVPTRTLSDGDELCLLTAIRGG